MCFRSPKAPPPDPQIAKDQAEIKQAELQRLAAEKEKELVQTKRTLRGTTGRSLLGLATRPEGSGFGSNYP